MPVAIPFLLYDNDDDIYCSGGDGSSSPWSIFSVSTVFGNFSFVEAKGIDAAWNLVAGHGGQFVLTWISFKVIVPSLYRIAEQSMVPIDSYTNMTLFGPNIGSMGPIIKALVTTKGPRAKANLSFMLFVTVFILAWPTLLDITTGYTPRQTTMKSR